MLKFNTLMIILQPLQNIWRNYKLGRKVLIGKDSDLAQIRELKRKVILNHVNVFTYNE